MVVQILIKQSCIYMCLRMLVTLITVKFNACLKLSIFVERITIQYSHKYNMPSILFFLGNLLHYHMQKQSENIKEDTKKKGNQGKSCKRTMRKDFKSEFLFLCSL